MKIIFIFPKGQSHNFWDLKFSAGLLGKKYSSLPLAIPTLAGLTTNDFNIEIIDENIKQINFEEKVDLVAISFFTAFSKRAYQISDEFRKRNVKVVLGGIHVFMLPEETLLHADSIVIGEAEDVWLNLLDDLKNGELKRIYKARERANLKKLCIPRWDLVNSENYSFFSVQATRGCPYKCEFCSVNSFFGKYCRFKPIQNVIEEVKFIKKIAGNKTIVFADDNFIANRKYAKQLIRELIINKVDNWWCQASINIAKDDELLKLMQRGGCKQVFIGFESLSQESLEMMNKGGVNKVEDYINSIEKIHSFKISIFGSFIFGYDGDDQCIFQKTVDFINDTNIAFALVGLMVPFPGTLLYDRLKKENRLLTEDWSKYDGEHVCFKPKKMSAKELQCGHKLALKQIYSYNNLSKRMNNLWNRGILVKKRISRKKSIFKKFILTTKILKNFFKDRDFARLKFIILGLYNRNNPLFFSIFSAIDFHEVVDEYLKNNSK